MLGARAVRSGFHARYDAKRRHYRYRLYHADVFLPYRRRHAWRIPVEPDLERINREAAMLVGERDFATFTSGAAEQRSTVRCVHYADFRRVSADEIEFGIGADGFLWRMVRSIVGTLIEREIDRARGRGPESGIEALLAARDRGRAGTSAPPQGLFLHDVEYTHDG